MAVGGYGQRVVCRFDYISLCLAHSGQMMSSSSVMNPRPTNEVLHCAQMKQSLCQCRSSNEINRVPPIPKTQMSQVPHKKKRLFHEPVIGREHDVHRLAKSSPKQSAQ